MSTNQSWRERDLAALWHPCSQMKDHEWLPLVPIRRGQGVWLEDYDGNRYIDRDQLLVGQPVRPRQPDHCRTNCSPGR